MLQGFSQSLDVGKVVFERSKKSLHHSSGGAPSTSLRVSSRLKEEQKSETLTVVAPATIASTFMVNAGVANALTGDDIPGAFYKVSPSLQHI